jgi:4-amino-4-deoxy-L-arabinose transferase-like glycosyltransferase
MLLNLERRLTSPYFFLFLIFIAFTLRMIAAFRVGLEVDEPINYAVSQYMLLNWFPATRGELLEGRQPYFYHPPFGFYIYAYWFGITEVSLDSLRIISVMASTIAIVLLSTFIRKQLSRPVGTLTLLLLATDGWLVVTNAMGYLENIQLILLAFAVPCYWWAVRSKNENWSFYILAGITAGSVFLFKHIGVYYLITIFIYFVTNLRERRHLKGHTIVLGAVILMSAIYAGWMYQLGDGDWFGQTRTQFERTVGLRESRGLNYSWETAAKVIYERYWFHASTILMLGSGTLISVGSFINQMRGRRYPDLYQVLVAWGMGAVIFAGLAALKSPHYLMLWLFPFAPLTAIILHRAVRQRPVLYLIVIALIIVLNSTTFYYRVVKSYVDVLDSAGVYIRDQIPDSAIVGTEPYIGVLFNPLPLYIRSDRTNRPDGSIMMDMIEGGATHLAVYWSTTAGIPRGLGSWPQIQRYCPKLVQYDGFKDHVYICKIIPAELHRIAEDFKVE